MNYCKYCGNPIPDGSVCNCQAAAAGNDGNAAPANANHSKKNLIIGGGVFLIALIIVIAFISSLFGGGYKSAIKDMEKALNKCDGELMAEVMLPDKVSDKLDKDDIKDLEDSLEFLIGLSEITYGEDIKFKLDIKDKEKLSDSDIKSLSKELNSMAEDYGSKKKDYKITKAYELDVEMTVSGDDKKDSENIDIVVIKIKGDGWKISVDSLESSIF